MARRPRPRPSSNCRAPSAGCSPSPRPIPTSRPAPISSSSRASSAMSRTSSRLPGASSTMRSSEFNAAIRPSRQCSSRREWDSRQREFFDVGEQARARLEGAAEREVLTSPEPAARAVSDGRPGLRALYPSAQQPDQVGLPDRRAFPARLPDELRADARWATAMSGFRAVAPSPAKPGGIFWNWLPAHHDGGRRLRVFIGFHDQCRADQRGDRLAGRDAQRAIRSSTGCWKTSASRVG